MADGSLPEEPLARFLETKRGYCTQFASAMIMLSRAAGIPARMAVGFLPGVGDGDDYVVRLSDAHAWPEALLLAAGLGAVRTDPQPRWRPPGVQPRADRPRVQRRPQPQCLDTVLDRPALDGPPRDVTADDLTGATGGARIGAVRFVSDHATTLLVILLAVLAVLVVPFGAWLARRRAHRLARDDAARVEAEWQSLLLRLQDIGFVPGRRDPRQASRQIGRSAYLTPDESDALGRVVTTLEQARYA